MGKSLRLWSNDEYSKWPAEVRLMNSYAVFMGHLSMGVRGLGFLVFTWTTVILLGGFVSTLQKKDFWCLTAITIVQVSGVFDASLKEKLVNIACAFRGLAGSVSVIAEEFYVDFLMDGLQPIRCESGRRLHDAAVTVFHVVVLLVGFGIQGLVFGIILCPLAAFYMSGLYISGALSLWRLVERDYIVGGGGDDPSKANLKPALDVLYSLALAQGVLFCYKTIFSLAEKLIAKHYVYNCHYRLSELPRDALLGYLEETRAGCEKDVSFARGRNLIVYAVELTESSKSPDRYVSGVRFMDELMPVIHEVGPREHHRLIKQLLTGGDIIHKLVQTLSARSPYDRETRVCAARILEHVAGEIHLEELPRGLHCVASLLVTFQEYSGMETYERDWRLDRHGTLEVSDQVDDDLQVQVDSSDQEETTDHRHNTTAHGRDARGYKKLMLVGLRILTKLAADKANWRVMSRDTNDLLTMIMAPVSSEGFHEEHHDEWTAIADGLLQLVSRLMAAPPKSEDKLQRQIASSDRLISTLESILNCPRCDTLHRKAVDTLVIDIHVDTSSFLACGSRENFMRGRTNFVWHLLIIFGDLGFDRKDSSIRELTGQMLQDMVSSRSEICAMIILDRDQKYFYRSILVYVLLHDKNNVCRIHAADILNNLCRHYTNDDQLLKHLKREIIHGMQKVLEETLPTRTEIQAAATEASNTKISSPDTDVEAQHSGLNSQGTEQQNNNSASSIHEKNEQVSEAMTKLQEALVSLCETVRDTWISADPDVGRELDEIAATFCSKQGKPVRNYASLVKEARERLEKKKAQESATNVPATSSSMAT